MSPALRMDPALADEIAPDRDAYVAAGIWTDERLGDVVAAYAATRPDAEAVVDRKGLRRVTFAELDRLANCFANYLLASGIEQGDVIGVQLPNCLEAAVVAVGANRAGVAVTPMLTLYRAKEIGHMLRTARARALVVPDTYRGFSHRELALGIAAGLEHDVQVIAVPVTDDDGDGPQEWLDGLAAWSALPCGRRPPASDVSVILFTSGTESAPKAIMHTEQTLNCNVRSVWRSFEMGEDEVVWMPSPVGHDTGFTFGIRYALLHGVRVVLQDRWAPDEALALIERERPTYTLTATVFLTDILRAAEGRDVDLSCLRIFGCGGSPIPPHVVTAAAERGINVLRLYGQTETLVATLNRPSSPLEKLVETDGSAADGFQVEIRDGDGAPLPPGVPGELCVLGPGMSVGYLGDPERTRVKFRRGWAHTADLAVMDEDGYVTIVGRKSEMIIRGGLNIAPREIEDEIERLDGVVAAAVVGLPHERLGEYCCAVIVPEPGADLTLDAVCDHLRAAGLAAYKLPQRLELVDELPVTPTGKVQRHRLVERLERLDADADTASSSTGGQP